MENLPELLSFDEFQAKLLVHEQRVIADTSADTTQTNHSLALSHKLHLANITSSVSNSQSSTKQQSSVSNRPNQSYKSKYRDQCQIFKVIGHSADRCRERFNQEFKPTNSVLPS